MSGKISILQPDGTYKELKGCRLTGPVIFEPTEESAPEGKTVALSFSPKINLNES